QPSRHHPLVQAERTVFHDGARLRGKLPALMPRIALPAVVLQLPCAVLGAAPGALYAIRPTTRHKVFPAVVEVGEVNDCLLQGGRLFARTSTLHERCGVVNYIIAFLSPLESPFFPLAAPAVTPPFPLSR